uniref:Uncharacterized protein n=1 Tax=Glossina morsitans morsitans TaxID=37546 RepID=A0A1B0G5U9_GLOMM
MKELLLENPRIGMRELSSELNVSCAIVHNILTDHLDLRRVIMRIVPKELDFVQKNYRKQMALDMLHRTSTDPTFMKRIITGGSTWVYDIH